MHLTVLSDSFLFNCFDDSCLRALAKKMHRHHHLPGHQILHEGDDIDSVHLVRRGKIDIMVHNKQCGTISESYLLKLACTVVYGSSGNSTPLNWYPVQHSFPFQSVQCARAWSKVGGKGNWRRRKGLVLCRAFG